MVTIKSKEVYLGVTIAVTMYRPQSGGFDLQRLDVAATVSVSWSLLDYKYTVIS